MRRCYAAQQGKFGEVAGYLERASQLDADFKHAALEDPDLEPYWRSLAPRRTNNGISKHTYERPARRARPRACGMKPLEKTTFSTLFSHSDDLLPQEFLPEHYPPADAKIYVNFLANRPNDRADAGVCRRRLPSHYGLHWASQEISLTPSILP